MVLKIHYNRNGLYFTYEIFTLIDSNTRNRDSILIDLNNSIDNLYENQFFLNMIDNNNNIKEIMEEICTKVDILTEKYLNKSFCNVMFDELWRQYLNMIKSITVNNRRNNSRVILSDEDDSDNEDDFVKKIKHMVYIYIQYMDKFQQYILHYL